MKTIYVSLLGLLLSLMSYSQVQTSPKENGWYHIIDGEKDSISKEPIVTVKDFTALKLDSDTFGKLVIFGTISEYKLNKWADATEKAIGKRIGYVHNNKVITDPQVNMRIESGNFLISNPHNYNLKDIYWEIRQEKALEDNPTDSTETTSNKLNSKLLWEEANRYRATIADSTFLITKGIMSDKAIDPLVPEGWNKNYAYNQVIYLKALERAKRHLVVKDNQFICSLKSGKDINISEDIYIYIYRLFDDWNRWVATGQYKIVKDKNGFYDIIPCKQQ